MNALLYLKLREEVDHRVACQSMLTRFADTEDPLAASFTAWTCALIPDSVDDYSSVVTLAAKATSEKPNSDQFLNSHGAVLFCAGRYEEAIERLTELVNRREQSDIQPNSSPAYTWYFLAMTHHSLGHSREAQNWLNKANEWTEQALSNRDNPRPWNRRLTLVLLRTEAESLIEQNEDNEVEPETMTCPIWNGTYGENCSPNLVAAKRV